MGRILAYTLITKVCYVATVLYYELTSVIYLNDAPLETDAYVRDIFFFYKNMNETLLVGEGSSW